MPVELPNTLSVPDNVEIVSVSELTERVRALLETGLNKVWVEGEISNLARPSSGHVYFTLKDDQATLRCVMYRHQVYRLPSGFEPKNGTEVIAFGRVSVYAPRGEYQLLVERMLPKGIGAAELALRQLREKLFNLGYFDVKRKKRLPSFPRSACLIASATGAAVRDMIELFSRRWPATRLYVRHSRVQGEGAAEEIAEAIHQVNQWHQAGYCPFDAIILGRGGGSKEDLAAFNTEVVAEAIYRSKIPVVSAVGHEIDITIADLVADVRASTPSHAVELVAPDRAEILKFLEGQRSRLFEAIRRAISDRRRRLDQFAQRSVMRRPLDRLRDLERRLDDWQERLNRAIRGTLQLRRKELDAVAQSLESLSPLRVLARGYSLTRRHDREEYLRSSDQVAVGDRLVTILHRGSVVSRVESVRFPPEVSQ